ncbi:MAG: beta-ketoacyl synthase N-terminal-like domain-containing protein, partial [Bdellovibrionota bacterium]
MITGLGAVTPLGLNRADTWAGLLAGRSGIQTITQFDTKDCPVTFAGEVKGFDPVAAIGSSKDARKMGRFTQLAVAAGREAYQDSGMEAWREKIEPSRIGVNIGVGMGGLPEIEEVYNELKTKGYRRVTPFFIPQVIPNLAAGQLSIALNLQGPNLCITTACASGAHSIGESMRHIRDGVADVMLAGGAESVICALGIGGFAAARALSTRNESPASASRPYDRDRDGFVMGEGAAVLVLEEYE